VNSHQVKNFSEQLLPSGGVMFLFQYLWLASAIQYKMFFVFFVTFSMSIHAHAREGLPSEPWFLSFEQSINIAQRHDPWLLGNNYQQSALQSLSNAQSSLPDAKVSLSLANLPIDTFNFNQEAMTQFTLGISQVFPRGDSLALNRQYQQSKSEAFPFQRQDRSEKVAVTVGSLWLEIYKMDQTSKLISESYVLFEQLVSAAQARYSAGIGNVRQHNIVRAQVELTLLQERLAKIQQHRSALQGVLLAWFVNVEQLQNQPTNKLSNIPSNIPSNALLPVLSADNISTEIVTLVGEMPVIMMRNSDAVSSINQLSIENFQHFFYQHPAVLAFDKQLQASKTSVLLAKQRHQPQWGLNASYGYRSDDMMNDTRSDLFSIGVSLDMPLFSNDRNDKYVDASIASNEAMKTEKWLLVRQLFSTYASAKARLLVIQQRLSLYQKVLVPQVSNLANVALNAYKNDDGEFSQVVKARITVLNTQIEKLALEIDQQKLILEINYVFASAADSSQYENNQAGSE
jgi:outer membrane protein TolC